MELNAAPLRPERPSALDSVEAEPAPPGGPEYMRTLYNLGDLRS